MTKNAQYRRYFRLSEGRSFVSGLIMCIRSANDRRRYIVMSSLFHGTGTEIRYQDPSALPWSKMATATTGKDVYTAIIPRQWPLHLV